MKLLSLVSKKRKRATVMGIDIWFARLNWDELGEFQEFAKSAEKGDNEVHSAVTICTYIIEKYVTDEDGEPVIDPADVRQLPVDFCRALIDAFTGGLASTEEVLEKK